MYSHAFYKHPYILDEQTIIFSSFLNPYVSLSEKYIFLDLINSSEKLIENIPYNTNDYDSNNQLNNIHKFDNCIAIIKKGKNGQLFKENNNQFSFIKKFDDKNLLGNNLYFFSNNLIIAWDFFGKTIKFVHYD